MRGSHQPRLRPTLRVPRFAPADLARFAARAPFVDEDFFMRLSVPLFPAGAPARTRAGRDFVAGFVPARARAGFFAARAGAVATARSRAGRGIGRSPAPVIGSGRLGGGGSGGSAAAP